MYSIYRELTLWYRLLDPCEDHADEAASYRAALETAVAPGPSTLLELGAGAGNNAYHLKAAFTCTLSDPSKAMLALSSEINPECEHVVGDMRTLRLERTFDAVFVHDGVVYMLSEDDLRAAARTAYVHTRQGGAAVFAPDCVRETFAETTQLHEASDGKRALRCIEWMWDPDPLDDTYAVEYVFVLRDEGGVRAVHERHHEGLFSIETWRRVLTEEGYAVDTFLRPIEDTAEYQAYCEEVFICRRL